MKSYKKLDKPTSFLEVPLENWGVLAALFFASMFVVNVLGMWISVKGWMYGICLLATLTLFYILRKGNKQRVPHYFQSRLAWMVTPRSFQFNGSKLFTYDQSATYISTKKKERAR